MNPTKIPLTDPQREAVGQVMADAFGAHIQSGLYAGNRDWVYVSWQFGLDQPTLFAYIDRDGAVTYA